MERLPKKKIWESAELNSSTYYSIFNQIVNLYTTSIKWKNLPIQIPNRWVERCLLYHGKIAYFINEIEELCALPFTIQNNLNIYDEPNLVKIYANNGYQTTRRNNDDCVCCWNTYSHRSDIEILRNFALRLYRIIRAIDVNISHQKYAGLFFTNEKNILSILNMLMEYDGNEPYILLDKKINKEDISTLDFNSPYVVDKLRIEYNQTFNELLSFIGIENSNQDKKERMVADEVGSNYGLVEAQRKVRLNPREECCRKLNAIFGTDISVTFNSDLISNVNTPTLNQKYVINKNREVENNE